MSETSTQQPKTHTWRWIMAIHNPGGLGGAWERLETLDQARSALIQHGKNSGFYQDLTVYGEYGPTALLYPYDEQSWKDAQESPGNPFDYPSYEVKSGPRGGVRITRA